MNENATPAQKLYVELTTRIVSQKLHYRSGSEETAASSVSSVFASTRKLLTEHADAVLFERVALALLNGVMRPYTARWHGWMTADVRDLDASGKPNLKFRDERVRRMFRAELVELQGKIQPYLDMLTSLKSASDEKHSAEDCFCHDDLTQLTSDESSTPSAKLGGPLIAGISDAVAFTGKLKGQDLFSKERETIAKRRKALGLEHTEDTDDTQGKEGNLANAAGLALSGGGIRSATFCLGVVQVLQKHGLLLNFDYLSTVSGGGYLGAFLSCALGTESPKPKSFKGTEAPASVTLEPLATEPVTARPASLETKPTAEPVPHIYDNARTTETFQRHGEQTESSLLRHMRNNSKYLLNGGLAAKLQITGLMVTGFLWNLFMVVPIPIFAAVLVVWLKDWLWGTGALEADTLFPPLFDGFHGRFLLASGFCLVVLWFILPLIQWWARRKDSDTWRQRFRTIEEAANWWGLTTAAIAALYLLPALIIGYGALAEKLVSLNPNWLLNSNLGDIASLSSAAVFSITLGLLATWITPRLPILRTLAVNLFILSGPLLMLLVFLFVCHRLGMATNHAEWNPWNPLSVIVVTAIVLFWIWFLVDINTLAPHRYYRKKLCECYLTRRSTGESGVESLQQVKLSALNYDAAAPYHLINMTLNTPTSRNKNLRGRNSDFFIASKHFIGSPITGYQATEELEKIDPHFDLGTAMAISGAAASTSMGWKSLPNFRFLMSLFNIRLGYWVRNPGKSKFWPKPIDAPGPWYFLRETFARMDESLRYVNLSDGGHIENLAVYELLRRKCKFIVCIDAGQEPGMECSDLIRLEHYATIDLDIAMHYDIRELMPQSNGLSRAHALLVKIEYDASSANKQLGWMLYLKLAVTGVEPNFVREYRRQNNAFPHQTTANQFFDEAQFEAYRALGACAMEGMFRSEIMSKPAANAAAKLEEEKLEAGKLESWFQALANNLLPDNDAAFK